MDREEVEDGEGSGDKVSDTKGIQVEEGKKVGKSTKILYDTILYSVTQLLEKRSKNSKKGGWRSL